MGKFRKEGKKEVPQVSTSSLPDIVYMLIFFFMITTTMRDSFNFPIVNLGCF